MKVCKCGKNWAWWGPFLFLFGWPPKGFEKHQDGFDSNRRLAEASELTPLKRGDMILTGAGAVETDVEFEGVWSRGVVADVIEISWLRRFFVVDILWFKIVKVIGISWEVLFLGWHFIVKECQRTYGKCTGFPSKWSTNGYFWIWRTGQHALLDCAVIHRQGTINVYLQT